MMRYLNSNVMQGWTRSRSSILRDWESTLSIQTG